MMMNPDHSFEILYRQYYKEVCRVSCFILKNEETAEEIAQEAFFQAYRKQNSLRAPDKFGPWVKTIALNLAKRYAAREAKLRSMIWLAGDFTPSSAGWGDPLRSVERREREEDFYHLLARLKHPYRQMLLLKYHYRWTEAKLSSFYKIPLGTVKSRLFRAKHMLVRELTPE
jgi:RNA polymerase sigma-70 factor (ECF subfamily)